MISHEKRLPEVYNRMANITLVQYKCLLVEKEVAAALLSDAVQAYEKLVTDILEHNEFRIDGRTFKVSEELKEEK